MITAIAIDDEPKALQVIAHHANRMHELQLVQSFTQVDEAISYLGAHVVDVIFLDINMPKLSGIEFLKALDYQPNVIFTTAYSEYAIDSFEHKTIDYLLKPITFERFEVALDKLREKLLLQTTKSFCFVKDGNKLVKLNFDELLFIKGAGNYLEMHTQKAVILPRMNFNDVFQLLPTGKFIRVHQSYIVSVEQIERIENNHIYIGESQIPISSKYRDTFYSVISRR